MLFFSKKLNHIGDLFENNCKVISWEDLRAKLSLKYKKEFDGDKLSTQSFVLGKKYFYNVITISVILLLKNIKHQIYCLENLNSKELYNMQLILKVEKPTAQTYFEKNLRTPELKSKDIYIPYLDE